MIRDLYDGVADGGDSSNNGGDGNGCGDGGNIGVMRDLYDGVADGGDRFSRLRSALSDEIEWNVRVFHNKRVQDEKEEELRDLIAGECAHSFDLCRPDPRREFLEYRCGVVDDCTGE